MYYKDDRRYFLGYTLFFVLHVGYLQPESICDTLGTTQVLVRYDPHLEAQDHHRALPVLQCCFRFSWSLQFTCLNGSNDVLRAAEYQELGLLTDLFPSSEQTSR